VRHTLIRWMLVALLAIGLVAVAACGSDDGSTSGGASSAPAKKKIRVGLVTDTGGLNDRSFNALAYKGLKRAKSDLGADIRVLISKANSDYVPNLSALARQKYDLIVGNGFLMADAMAKVAKSFPTVNFAIIDFSAADLKGKPRNVRGLLFKEQEAGYLVGYLAGLYVKAKGGQQVVSTVGGAKIPPVDHYIAGFQAGAKKANPAVKALNAYVQVFDDPAKGKELGLNQIADGSQVIFQVAGQSGLGALDAAKEKGAKGIGVDADQLYLGPQMLTSALKKVDNAVFQTSKEIQGGQFKGGNTVFDLKSGGVGLGSMSPEAEKYKPEVDKIAKQIVSGKIAKIPDAVK
jgi:basic membrane protein A and related proteins